MAFRYNTVNVARTCAKPRGLNHHSRSFHQSLISRGSPDIYDVVCVGGGPAGFSFVNALRASTVTKDLKVALIESQDLSKAAKWQENKSPEDYSNRCSSLTPSSAQFLADIGVWSHLDESRVQPYNRMNVWDGISGSHITFDGPSAAVPANHSYMNGQQGTIAYMVENNNLLCALSTRAEEIGGFTIFDNSRVEQILLGEDEQDLDLRSWPVLQLAGGVKIAARLLVGADGINSPVRGFAGIQSRGWDYERHGVVATLRTEADLTTLRGRIAYQRFLPTGPVALLPLPGNFASLVWSTTSSHAALLKSLSHSDFIAMVNAAFRLSSADLEFLHGMSNGQVEEVTWRESHTNADSSLMPNKITDVQAGTVASFPLRMRHTDTYVGERIALIGDAAHTIHPLAGQGLNQGQGDCQALVQTIEDAVLHGQDIGSTMSLEPYNAKRYARNNAMLGVVDKLHKLYSVSSGPLVAARSLGLSAVNALGPLKSFFMSQASGR